MYKVHLFQYKSQFNTVFRVIPGNQCSPNIFHLANAEFTAPNDLRRSHNPWNRTEKNNFINPNLRHSVLQ
jgi:hypothetical protein